MYISTYMYVYTYLYTYRYVNIYPYLMRVPSLVPRRALFLFPETERLPCGFRTQIYYINHSYAYESFLCKDMVQVTCEACHTCYIHA